MDGYIDEWLVDLQGDGETAGQALEKLYQEMYRSVFLLAASITNDTAMAEDAAHEVFLTLRRQAARYTPGSSGRAWIFSITRNVSRYLLRTARAEEHKIRNIDDGAEFETCVLEDIVIAKAMAALNVNEYKTIVLHVFGGYSLKEIAVHTDTPYGTVLWRYHKARGKLVAYYEGSADT
jgi:RNA polymerase sigma factor, sigma-70 family